MKPENLQVFGRMSENPTVEWMSFYLLWYQKREEMNEVQVNAYHINTVSIALILF